MQLSGNIFDYLIVFWAGVLVSFTPCVYPVLPLTAGFIAGINTTSSKRVGFIVSLIYVFGMAITYCALAVVASLTGQVFGQIQNNPITFLVIGVILLIFGLGMLDVISFPTLGFSFHGHIKTKNIWTVILFGMASGLVVGPCTAPILGWLLLYIASKKNLWHGVSLTFFFSYGVGASLIVVGTFSGLLAKLPKSGPWLSRVKQFCGIIILIGAAYFLIQGIRLMFLM